MDPLDGNNGSQAVFRNALDVRPQALPKRETRPELKRTPRNMAPTFRSAICVLIPFEKADRGPNDRTREIL